MGKQWFPFHLFRLTSFTQICSVPNGGFSRTGLNLEPCRMFIIWLPRCTCSGQGLRWAEPMRKCFAIGSVFYRVSRLLDSSWFTALQERVTVSWNGQQQPLTAPTRSAGSTQGAEHTKVHRAEHYGWPQRSSFPNMTSPPSGDGRISFDDFTLSSCNYFYYLPQNIKKNLKETQLTQFCYYGRTATAAIANINCSKLSIPFTIKHLYVFSIPKSHAVSQCFWLFSILFIVFLFIWWTFECFCVQYVFFYNEESSKFY